MLFNEIQAREQHALISINLSVESADAMCFLGQHAVPLVEPERGRAIFFHHIYPEIICY